MAKAAFSSSGTFLDLFMDNGGGEVEPDAIPDAKPDAKPDATPEVYLEEVPEVSKYSAPPSWRCFLARNPRTFR